MQYFTKKNISDLEALLKVKKADSEFEKNLWEKVDLYKKYLSFLPGISCVCICNSLAMKSCHTGSDIDLFVITQKNRLWTARIFLTLFFTILGQRKTHTQHAGKFCLSFFISEQELSLEKIALRKDIYLAYWIKTLVPILNTNHTLEHFHKQNTWYHFESAHETPLPHFCAHETPLPNPLLPGEGTSYQKMRDGNLIGNFIEILLKKIFLPRTKKSFQHLGKPFGIVITDTMLKFHNEDQRETISQQIQE